MHASHLYKYGILFILPNSLLLNACIISLFIAHLFKQFIAHIKHVYLYVAHMHLDKLRGERRLRWRTKGFRIGSARLPVKHTKCLCNFGNWAWGFEVSEREMYFRCTPPPDQITQCRGHAVDWWPVFGAKTICSLFRFRCDSFWLHVYLFTTTNIY